MLEQQKPQSESLGAGPDALGDIFATNGSSGLVTCSHGPYCEQLPVATMTVGEIRGRYRDRFDIAPEATAIVDGHRASEDTVVQQGQLLMFMRKAGEKGSGRRRSRPIIIQQNSVQATSPEGQKAAMPLSDFLNKLTPTAADTGEMILPDGVKCVLSRGRYTIWVHQTPPRVCQLRWIANNSPVKFGKGARYRDVTVALPYLIVFAVFGPGEENGLQLTQANECFFRNEPLRSLNDELSYPALLNCSKFEPPEGKPLSWICSQYLKPAKFARIKDENQRMRAGFDGLMQCLLETGFNYSSEHHEACSWFTASQKIDSRLASIEQWQMESEKDRLFVLDVPWLPTEYSVKQVADRIFQNQSSNGAPIRTTTDIARLVFNHSHGR